MPSSPPPGPPPPPGATVFLRRPPMSHTRTYRGGVRPGQGRVLQEERHGLHSGGLGCWCMHAMGVGTGFVNVAAEVRGRWGHAGGRRPETPTQQSPRAGCSLRWVDGAPGMEESRACRVGQCRTAQVTGQEVHTQADPHRQDVRRRRRQVNTTRHPHRRRPPCPAPPSETYTHAPSGPATPRPPGPPWGGTGRTSHSGCGLKRGEPQINSNWGKHVVKGLIQLCSVGTAAPLLFHSHTHPLPTLPPATHPSALRCSCGSASSRCESSGRRWRSQSCMGRARAGTTCQGRTGGWPQRAAAAPASFTSCPCLLHAWLPERPRDEGCPRAGPFQNASHARSQQPDPSWKLPAAPPPQVPPMPSMPGAPHPPTRGTRGGTARCGCSPGGPAA